MARFNCAVCGYSSETISKPEKCSYCGKKGAMIEEENAEELVSEL